MNSSSWGTFPHTADIGLWVTGSDLSEIFRQSGTALMQFIFESIPVGPIKHMTLSYNSDNNTDNLIAFLNDLIFLLETDNLVFNNISDFNNDVLSTNFKASFIEVSFDSLKYIHFVKAVTYHLAEINIFHDLLEARFVLDL